MWSEFMGEVFAVWLCLCVVLVFMVEGCKCIDYGFCILGENIHDDGMLTGLAKCLRKLNILVCCFDGTDEARHR